MRSLLVRAGAVTAAAVAALAFSPAMASADPPSGTTPARTDIVGVGSDTTEKVLNAYSALYNKAHSPKLYSFDATGPSRITPAAGCAAITRPNGSGAGLAALLADRTGCIDFARSSRTPKADGSEKSLAFIAFAKDGVAPAVALTTNAGSNITSAQLRSIYTCTARTWNQVGGKNGSTIKPLLPQTASGTRAFFLSAIGITEAQVGSCVIQGSQENNQTAIAGDPNKIAPFSVARYSLIKNTGQTRQISLSNVDGTKAAALFTQDGKQITSLSGSYTTRFTRTVFNAVKRVNGSVPDNLRAVFGSAGYICTNADAKKTTTFQGFRPDCTGSLQTSG